MASTEKYLKYNNSSKLAICFQTNNFEKRSAKYYIFHDITLYYQARVQGVDQGSGRPLKFNI